MLNKANTSHAGFTLIELMIVVAIVAILASIAYPSYVDNVREARRSDAQADLLRYAAFAERTFTEANSYRNASIASSGIASDFYNYGVDFRPADPAEPATSFTITATAINDQRNDSCGNMTLTNTEARGNTGTNANCW